MKDRSVNALLVDDDRNVLDMIAETLENDPKFQWLIHRTTNPRIALDMANIMATLDIVLTDYSMPELTGVELAKALRKGGYRGAIVLITAGASSAGPIPTDVFDHVTEILMKPFGREALFEVAHRLLVA